MAAQRMPADKRSRRDTPSIRSAARVQHHRQGLFVACGGPFSETRAASSVRLPGRLCGSRHQHTNKHAPTNMRTCSVRHCKEAQLSTKPFRQACIVSCETFSAIVGALAGEHEAVGKTMPTRRDDSAERVEAGRGCGPVSRSPPSVITGSSPGAYSSKPLRTNPSGST